jgi:Ca-activated chloride channel family protein
LLKRTQSALVAGLFLALAPLVAPAFGRSQQPAPPPASASESQPEVATLRVNTRTVEISAVVRNKTGEPQSALGKDDFILKEDGKEQPIHYFSVGSDLPLTLALLVDVSFSQRTFIGDEWRASDVFFESMLTGKRDRAMLVQVDARVQQLMAMTSSVSSLHLALTQLGQNSATSGATRLNDAVLNVSHDILAKEKGRKAIILLTDGGENASRATLDQAIAASQRANVPVYAILYSAFAGGVPLNYGVGAIAKLAGDPGEALLKKLTESTGGRVYTVAHGMPLKKIYEAIGNDLRTQYELGYTPPPDLQPNSFHKLEVKAKDKKLTVQARNGFYVQP